MKRRDFITLLGGAAAAWPPTARAQQTERVRRVAVLMGYAETDPQGQARFQAFRQGLVDLGWVVDHNLRLDMRWAADVAGQQSGARELVGLAPEVILTATTPATQAVQTATRTIPIVFMAFSDPIATKVVSNLARPEANATGFMAFEYSMAGKWLSLLKDIAPGLARVTLLFDPDTAPYAPFYIRVAQDAGERLALKITAVGVRDAPAIEAAIAAIAGDGGLVVLPGGIPYGATTIALAAKHRVPAIYSSRSYPANGGLVSYAPDARLLFRDGATYVDRILRGAKPAELPVQLPTKFEMVINLKTAKALGLTLPPSLLARADEVIE